MSPDDLYTRLDLPRDATPEQVKKAYRRLSKLYHPDPNGGGGDPEAFRAVQAAYDVLGDPTSRARYDATGETGDRTAVRQKAAETLTSLFSVLMTAELCVPARDNLAELAKKKVAQAMEESAARHQQAKRQAAALRDAASRFTVKDGAENLPANVLSRQAEAKDAEAAAHDKEFIVLEEAERMLAAYSYRTDGAYGFSYSPGPIISRFH
jgi:curved DNA-binding protein CbpA